MSRLGLRRSLVQVQYMSYELLPDDKFPVSCRMSNFRKQVGISAVFKIEREIVM